MKYSKVSLSTRSGIAEALSNLIFTLNGKGTVMDIYDAIEDSKDEIDLEYRLNHVPEMLKRIKFDRKGDGYIRYTCTDCWGNISYLKIMN